MQNSTFFTGNFHDSVCFSRIKRFSRITNTIKSFLYVTPSKADLVVILDFVVRCSHRAEYTSQTDKSKLNMRQKHKSNVAGFHSAKGGAIPTLTHQKIRI